LLTSLDAALVPSKADPNSVEAMIDALVHYEEDPWRHASLLFDPKCATDRLARLGFRAVPALINALDDKRLTRTARWLRPDRPLRIQDFASDLLVDIAGRDAEGGALRREWHTPITKADAVKWWNEAKKSTEEAYAVARVFPKDRNVPDLHQLAILQARYPHHLPQLYHQLLKGSPKEYHNWALADAVATSSLPRKQKVDLLRAGACHQELLYRQSALEHLEALDPATFRRVLGLTFHEVPRDATGNHTSPYVSFVRMLRRADDAIAWKAFEESCQRVSVGLRMAFLAALAEHKAAKPSIYQRQMTLLASFLDDSARTDANEVRNLAALEMARLLGIDVPLNPERSAKEWARLRRQVQTAWNSTEEARCLHSRASP
jgi:hypothetical protein